MDSGHATMSTVANGEQVPVSGASYMQQQQQQQQQVSAHVHARSANDRSSNQARLRRPATPPVRLTDRFVSHSRLLHTYMHS